MSHTTPALCEAPRRIAPLGPLLELVNVGHRGLRAALPSAAVFHCLELVNIASGAARGPPRVQFMTRHPRSPRKLYLGHDCCL